MNVCPTLPGAQSQLQLIDHVPPARLDVEVRNCKTVLTYQCDRKTWYAEEDGFN